jgi:hypothetical protein
MATVTSSRRRSERTSGSKKVAASTPKPRQTSVGNRGAQAGPIKPATRTNNVSTPPTRPTGRMMSGAMKGAGEAAIYTVANAALSPLARKAGTALGKSIKGAMTPKPTKKVSDSFSGQYQKGSPSKKAAPKMSKAKSFDNAFASARNSGMKTFVWEGKKYTTKMK